MSVAHVEVFDRAAAAAPDVNLADRWAIVLPHRDRLRILARSRGLSPHDAEDCVQETLLRAVTFAGLDPDRVDSFLTTVCLRLCADAHRHHVRSARLGVRVAMGDVAGAGPDERVCDESEARWLLGVASRLAGRE